MVSNAMNPQCAWRSGFFAAVTLLAMLCPALAQKYEGRELVQAKLLETRRHTSTLSDPAGAIIDSIAIRPFA